MRSIIEIAQPFSSCGVYLWPGSSWQIEPTELVTGRPSAPKPPGTCAFSATLPRALRRTICPICHICQQCSSAAVQQCSTVRACLAPLNQPSRNRAGLWAGPQVSEKQHTRSSASERARSTVFRSSTVIHPSSPGASLLCLQTAITVLLSILCQANLISHCPSRQLHPTPVFACGALCESNEHQTGSEAVIATPGCHSTKLKAHSSRLIAQGSRLIAQSSS